MKLPAFQFYPADWRKDPGVQSLDFHTRGVWFEILCIMHESSERGVLLLNGLPMPEDALSRMLGLDKQILTTGLTTLLTYGVASRRGEDGAIYSRRMVRDENTRKVRAESGKLGGNPVLLKQKPTTGVKHKPTPSTSSSFPSSSSEDMEKGKGGDLVATRQRDEAMDHFKAVHLELLNAPYIDKQGDYVQLAALRKACGCESRATPDGWQEACRNYLSKPTKGFTVAALVKDYASFRNSSVDRYGAMTAHKGAKIESPTEAKERRTKENLASLIGRDITPRGIAGG
jgi:hypothetical protein